MKKIVVLSIFAINYLIAATPNVDVIQKDVVIPNEVEEKKSLIELDGKEKYLPVMKEDKTGKKSLLIDFEILGNDSINTEELKQEINSFLNKEVNFTDLQEITSVLTKLYRDKGYFVARAYLPKQNLQENKGVLKLVIIEGNHGEFKVSNKSLVKDSILQDVMGDIKKETNVVETNTLERAMLIINETPGAIITKAEIKPGKEVGTSDFGLEIEETKRLNGYAVIDNYGSKYVGRNRLMSNIDINSPMKIGDKISLFGLVSNGTDLKNYKISYNFPLMPNGLRGETSYSNTDYNLVKLGDGILDEEYYGDSETIEAKILYPIIKSRFETLDFTFTYTDKNISSTTDEKDEKDINSVGLGFLHSKNQIIIGNSSKTVIEGIFTVGELNDNNEMNGSYQKINLNTSIDMNLTQIYSMASSLKLQKAFKNKNLDGSEDMSIGGANGVKLFPDAELSAEQGVLFNIETFAKLPNISNLNHKIGVFYDIGTTTMSDKSIDEEFQSRTLQDVGVGYYTNYKNAFTKLQVARVVGGQDIETESVGNISRVLFQGGLTF